MRFLRRLSGRNIPKVRAPWIKRKLKLPCAVRTVRRVTNDAGYKLPKLTNRRVLTAATKSRQVAWAEARRQHPAGGAWLTGTSTDGT